MALCPIFVRICNTHHIKNSVSVNCKLCKRVIFYGDQRGRLRKSRLASWLQVKKSHHRGGSEYMLRLVSGQTEDPLEYVNNSVGYTSQNVIKMYKRSVLRSRDTNRNIKKLVYCRYG